MLPRQFLPWVDSIGPAYLRKKIIQLIPYEPLQTMLQIIDTMDHTSVDIFQKKKTALMQGDKAVQEQVGKGKDIMSVLRMYPFSTLDKDISDGRSPVKANMEANKEDRLPEEELLGQMR